MAEERIVIRVDDAEVDMAIAKLKQAMTMATTSFPVASGELSDFAAFWDKIGKDMRTVEAETGFSLADLPSINREARILLGQLPGLRSLMRAYFNIKRLGRGLEAGGLELYMSIAVAAILIATSVLNAQKRMEQKQVEYDAFLRREKGLSLLEFNALVERPEKERQSYFWGAPTP